MKFDSVIVTNKKGEKIIGTCRNKEIITKLCVCVSINNNHGNFGKYYINHHHQFNLILTHF